MLFFKSIKANGDKCIYTRYSRLLGRFEPIFYFICKNKIHRASPCKQRTKKKISRIFKKKFVDFQNFQKSNFDGGKFLKIWSSINLPWGHVMTHKNLGLIVSAVLTFIGYKQTEKQTDRQAKFIYRLGHWFLFITFFYFGLNFPLKLPELRFFIILRSRRFT